MNPFRRKPPVRQEQVDRLDLATRAVCLTYELGARTDIDAANAERDRVWRDCTPAEREAASRKTRQVTKAGKTKARKKRS